MTHVPTVREIMTASTLRFAPEMPAYEAIDKMISKKLAGVPVIDGVGKLVGFLTEKDCLRMLAVSHMYNTTGRRVQDFMSQIKEALEPELDLLSAAMRFLNCNFVTLPVLEGETLVGSINRHDIMRAIEKFYRDRGLDKAENRLTLKLVENPTSIEDLQTLVARTDNAQLASVFGGRHSG